MYKLFSLCDEPMTDRLGPMGRDNTYGEREGGGTSGRARLQREDGSVVACEKFLKRTVKL